MASRDTTRDVLHKDRDPLPRVRLTVETPAQAFNTFSRSEMDALYLGNYVVYKEAKKIIDSTPFMLRHEGDRVAEMVS